MKLGAFSICLNVKDIQASQTFYSKLGFEAVGGDPAQDWLIMRNDACTIGLFKGMIEKNTLTFNPGWDQKANPLADFRDVRDIQKQLKSKGIKFDSEADEQSKGPASFFITDPDGNPILFDQHVDGAVKD